MWTRLELKTNAKNNLRGKYWTAFAASLIVSLLGGGGSGSFGYSFGDSDLQRFGNQTTDWQNFDWQAILTNTWFLLILVLLVTIALIAILYTVFVASVIQVGGNRWFSRNREAAGVPSLSQLFSLFRGGTWLPTVGSMFWMNFWLFLWSLLPTLIMMAGAALAALAGTNLAGLIPEDTFNFAPEALLMFGIMLILVGLVLSIPVIIKTYAYRLTPWILADNPTIGYRRALRLSISMTHGHKFEIFVLDLSFIGWFLLGVLACGIGVLFVLPYVQATHAELYAALRSNAVSQSLASMEEFGFVRIKPEETPA
jgi:uncharacterized membrane protein